MNPIAHLLALLAGVTAGSLDASMAQAAASGQAISPDTIFQGEAIVVRSSRSTRQVQEQATRVEVVDREEIAEKLLMRPGSIAMLLAETGGVQLQRTSAALGGAAVRIQGMPGRYTLLLADGLPLYGGQAGGLGVLQIPPVDLEEVEIIRGVASALYGGQALGGVINLVSRRPGDEPMAEFVLNGTSRGGADLVGYGELPLGAGWAATVTSGVHRQGMRDLDGTGWADLPGYDRGTLRLRVFQDHAEESGAHTYLTVGGLTEDRQGGTLDGRVLPGNLPPGSLSFRDGVDLRRLDVGLHVRRPLPIRAPGAGSWAELAFWDLRGSMMEGRFTRTFGTFGTFGTSGALGASGVSAASGLPATAPTAPTASTAPATRGARSTRFLETSLSGLSGAHTWVVGAALHEDHFTQRDVVSPSLPLDFRHTVPGFFMQDEVRLTDRGVTVAGSLRVDRHNTMGTAVSPRLSALVPGGGWDIRASVGRGHFAPTPLLDEVEAAGLVGLRAPATLEAETGWGGSLDLGGDAGILQWNATAFASEVEGEARLRMVEGGGYRVENVPGRHAIRGGELRLRARLDDVSITGSYLWVDARRPEVPGLPARDVTPMTPRHSLGLVAVWEDHDRGLLGLELYHTGRQRLEDNPWRTEGRSWLHAGLLGEVRMEGWSVFLNLENLLGVRQTRWDPLLLPAASPLGLPVTDAWAPLEGFTLNAGIRIRWGGERHHHDGHDPHDHDEPHR